MEYNLENNKKKNSGAVGINKNTVTGGNSGDGKSKITTKKPTHTYSDEEINELLEGYLNVHSSLWDFLPVGAHVRFLKKDAGDGLPKSQRFKPGGYIASKSRPGKEGKKVISIETIKNGKDKPNYISFPLTLDDVEELWKKYDDNTFIETHLIYSSLEQKKKQLEELTARVAKLEALIKK